MDSAQMVETIKRVTNKVQIVKITLVHPFLEIMCMNHPSIQLWLFLSILHFVAGPDHYEVEMEKMEL